MSKNVAVFVDVANIFYAAKAAGVDIDYVTLLKSATAGRDFVRAYAYTGLDPENENQRQFHAFLARSGYKVVSKDIRKYGDGRIKANLDIELVVDLMRMAEKLDVAVVVSGDGDFAPAIYAVQQQGVRVEVISFRGNTSSDLIDAADVFIDIATIAKVEKGVRSGRRVAAEGDLSMTQVPDKESGVTPRRRRRDGDERADRPERAPRRRGGGDAPGRDGEEPPTGGALVALPGEKLSRGGPDVEVAALADGDPRSVADEESESAADEGRRRRRRRGGRGRGRGSRAAEELVQSDDLAGPAELEEQAPDYPDEVPTLPQHAGFGSVWDSQLGAPPERRSALRAVPADESLADDELEIEPEVPEYLLAERRAQDRRRGGRGGRAGGYRSAIDRERYGTGSRYGASRGSGQGGQGGKGSRRPAAARASARSMEPIEQTPAGDSWSEVPPEVQELLRAELARRQASAAAPVAAVPSEAHAAIGDALAAPEAKPKRTTRRRSTTTAATSAESTAEDSTAPEAKPKRTTRRRSTTTAATSAEGVAEDSAAPEAKPKRTTRRRSTTKAAAAEESTGAEGQEA